MTEINQGGADRPLILGQVTDVRPYKSQNGGSSKVALPGYERQRSRLSGRFRDLDRAFEEEVQLSTSLGASDPELVVVFEALDEQVDLARIADRLGFEIISESEATESPDDDFPRTTKKDKTSPVPSCLHAICVDQTALRGLLGQWKKWRRTGEYEHGYAKLRDLFAHLKDVRAWGPQDRLKLVDWDAHLDQLLPDVDHDLELELWFRKSPELRARADAEVRLLVEQSGGRVLSSAVLEQVGYHGVKCVVPLSLLKRLVAGDFDAVTVVKSSHVMYLKVSGQSYLFSDQSGPTSITDTVPTPSGSPILCLLDGVPIANHRLLRGRVVVTDPDDLASLSSTRSEVRRHGTAMASACIWGDLSEPSPPSSRPLLVRPILAPSAKTRDELEELPAEDLAPDVMVRVFRELFDGDGDVPPSGADVVVLNLSVGDPAMPFDTVMSAWGRTIDWLSHQYGVLVVVSAGNHGAIPVPTGVGTIAGLNGEERARAVSAAVAESVPRRSLLAPADSINALTVGALNSDGSDLLPPGSYSFDPAEDLTVVNPLSAIGGGHRRSVKPELIAPGGRVLFRVPLPGLPDNESLEPALSTARGPGIRVAAPNASDEVFTTGTSPAAALVSHSAARLVEAIDAISPGRLKRELAVGAKALLVHGARVASSLLVDERLGHAAHGYGSIERNLSDGCAENEATLLFFGSLGANEMCDLRLPLPDGLQASGVKRLTATLAWLTPVNWRHRQYRRAVLSFAKPAGMTELPKASDVPSEDAKRGTVQHSVWEVNRAIPHGRGRDLELTVQCVEQAGGLRGERVSFAVAMSLWVAPELQVDVYEQVREQVQPRVPIVPGS